MRKRALTVVIWAAACASFAVPATAADYQAPRPRQRAYAPPPQPAYQQPMYQQPAYQTPMYQPPAYYSPPVQPSSCCCPTVQRGLFTGMSFGCGGSRGAYYPPYQQPSYGYPQQPYYGYPQPVYQQGYPQNGYYQNYPVAGVGVGIGPVGVGIGAGVSYRTY